VLGTNSYFGETWGALGGWGSDLNKSFQFQVEINLQLVVVVVVVVVVVIIVVVVVVLLEVQRSSWVGSRSRQINSEDKFNAAFASAGPGYTWT
jgi:signal transduction histidine kinase